MVRSGIIGAGLGVLAAGCSGEQAAQERSFDDGSVVAQASGGEAAGSAVDAQGRIFDVDAAESEVYWRIYRAGLMARLGHNHVISVGELDGRIVLGDDPSEAGWSLTIPVQGLVVDDPGIRARYGQDFSSEPSENDIAGTKRNMLSADVLNGEVYPEIRITGAGFTGSLDAAMLSVEVALLGRTIAMMLPGAVEIDADSVTVSGEFRLTHEQLGMERFTALGGAMSVGEEIDFTYRIHAVSGAR